MTKHRYQPHEIQEAIFLVAGHALLGAIIGVALFY